jgi:hypothetical protein
MFGCGSYCEHGGICILEAGHEGLHDSDYCRWDDAHALTEWEADAYVGLKDRLGVRGKGLL